MQIRPLSPEDREQLLTFIGAIDTFSEEEVRWARRLVEDTLRDDEPGDFDVLVADRGGTLTGYVAFGRCPMTESSWDVHWIASASSERGKGVGASLMAAMEGELRRRGAKLIRVETSALEAYGPTRGFYAAMKYAEAARIKDFYAEGEDLVFLIKRL